MKKKYAFGLDAVRVLAVVLVSLTHQVVRTGNYNYQPGIVWVFTMLCFYLSHSCVPLFLLLSGYLCGEKRPQKSYFRGIFRVAVPYLLISVLCVLKLWLWNLCRRHHPQHLWMPDHGALRYGAVPAADSVEAECISA